MSRENIDEIEDTLIGTCNIGESEEQDNGEDIGDYGSDDGIDGEEFEIIVESDVEDEFDENGNASDNDESENEADDSSGKNISGFARLFVGIQFDIFLFADAFFVCKNGTRWKKEMPRQFQLLPAHTIFRCRKVGATQAIAGMSMADIFSEIFDDNIQILIYTNKGAEDTFAAWNTEHPDKPPRQWTKLTQTEFMA